MPGKETKEKSFGGYLFNSGVLFEAVADPEIGYAFAIKKPGESVSLTSSVLVGNREIELPMELVSLLKSGMILLPSGAIEYGTQEDLLLEILGFIHRYCDILPIWEQLIAHYCLMTWVYDRFSALPYLRFLGEPSTGKTRLLQIASHLSFRTGMCGGSISGAGIFRVVDAIRGTIAIDEADFSFSDKSSDIVKVLNNGYMSGFPVIRCQGDSFLPSSFVVFGPKILSTRSTFQDHALETRCLTLQTHEQKIREDIPLQLPPSFYTEALSIRNKLLTWRFDNFSRITVDDSKMRNLSSRLGQIGSNLYSVSTCPKFKDELLEFLRSYGETQKSSSDSSAVVHALYKLTLNNTKQGSLSVKQVSDELAKIAEAHDYEWIGPKKTGLILRSLGIVPKREKSGFRFPICLNQLADLMKKYPPPIEG